MAPPDGAVYTPCYCEENVWNLLSGQDESELPSWNAVFVSNARRTVALWAQRAGDEAGGGVIVWDYHVFAVRDAGDGAVEVHDLDTTVEPFPAPARLYAARALLPAPPRFERRYRVVPGEEFLRTFASDRSHMRTGDGWSAPPPPYPPIRTADESNNLGRFIDTVSPGGPGRAMGEVEFVSLVLKL